MAALTCHPHLPVNIILPQYFLRSGRGGRTSKVEACTTGNERSPAQFVVKRPKTEDGMATRTVTKTRTKPRVREQEEQLESSEDGGAVGETSAAGNKRLIQLKARSARSLSSTPVNSSFDLSDSSDEDDFAADIREDIRREQDIREAKRKNGGRLPRRKQKESKADKQTQHTRKLLSKGA